MSSTSFAVKTIVWSQYEQKTPILLQEENGPCPLLAIVNSLLLQEDIEARTVQLEPNAPDAVGSKTQGIRTLLETAGSGRVDLNDIVDALTVYLRAFSGLDSETITLMESQMPSLVYGLDVDVNLVNGTCSQKGLASSLFKAFGLTFVHGWCREPNLGVASDKTFQQHQTYDELQDYLLKETSVESQEVQEWLKLNSTQLTPYGLRKLDDALQPDLISVFFRNNHFSSLYKGHDHDFYLLITDSDFSKHAGFVWQSLNSVSGGQDLFFTGDLVPIFEDANAAESPEAEADLKMARMLQEEEDGVMAEELLKKLNQKLKTSKATRPQRETETKKEEEPKKVKKKSGCVII